MKFKELNIDIKRSKRKTVSILIERDGNVSARVPEKIHDDELYQILQSKEYLIHRHLAEWQQLNEKKSFREYVSGQSFLYLGRNYRLKIEDDTENQLRFSKGRFLLPRHRQSDAKDLFIQFYKEKLNEKLPDIIKRYQNYLGVKPQSIKVMELQNRWASCSSLGNVNFHWKCAMAPIDVLHYIVAHELAHLIHPNHSSEFWNELDKIMPDHRDRHEWLKRNGAGMDL